MKKAIVLGAILLSLVSTSGLFSTSAGSSAHGGIQPFNHGAEY